MAILRRDMKRITLAMSKQFLTELDAHLKHFATDRSMWLREAAREKLAKEKVMLNEIDTSEE